MCCGALLGTTIGDDALLELDEALTKAGAIVGGDAPVCGKAGAGAGVG